MSVQIRSGQLRNTAQVQTKSEAADSYGEPDITWTTSSTVHRAMIEPMSGAESLVVFQNTPDVTHVVTMRYLSTLTTKDRLYINGARTFEIVSILDTETYNHEMKVACKELI